MAFGSRRLRRYRGSHSHGKISPVTVIIICVAIALIASLTVGNLLRIFMDEDAYRRLVEGEEELPVVNDPVKTNLPDIRANAFALGGKLKANDLGIALSVALNAPDGTLTYTSPVSEYFAFSGNGKVVLASALNEIVPLASYISGVYYPQAFAQENPDLFYAVAAQERALLREFLRNGGRDVLLAGVALDASTVSAISEYARLLKLEVGECGVGVAVPLAVAQAENGWEIIGTLLGNCDLCALDLRGVAVADTEAAKETLQSVAYYLLQYDMRLLLSSDQTHLIQALADSYVTDYQIVSPVE